jgi:hypothetical protein
MRSETSEIKARGMNSPNMSLQVRKRVKKYMMTSTKNYIELPYFEAERQRQTNAIIHN